MGRGGGGGGKTAFREEPCREGFSSRQAFREAFRERHFVRHFVKHFVKVIKGLGDQPSGKPVRVIIPLSWGIGGWGIGVRGVGVGYWGYLLTS